MVTPSSVRELAEFVANSSDVRVSGGWPHSHSEHPTLSLDGLTGIVELQASDQVVTVRAGTQIADLNAELRPYGLEIPMRGQAAWAGYPDSIAAMLSYDLPHGLSSQWGSWRDWVLGLSVVLADGRLVKSGSRVVKSVAGYDVHKLMIGARFSLAIPTELHLRLTPTQAVGEPEVPEESSVATWILRVSRSDFEAATYHENPVLADIASSTLWLNHRPSETYPNAWAMAIDGSDESWPEPSTYYRKRAKHEFDPSGKFSSAWAGQP
jgi:glycolate oxidase FAD binding subunit